MTADKLEATIAQLRRGRAMQQEELASPDPEFEAARAALEARLPAVDLTKPEGGADEEEAASSEAFEVLGDAERAVYEAEPTSPAGAIALLRFAADFLEGNGVNDTKLEDVFPDAIRRAADFFEGGGMTMATETTSKTFDDKLAEGQHLPVHINHLEDLDEHLLKASRLSRALWIALGNEEISSEDARTRYGLMGLASEVADLASAAEYVFGKKARTA